MELWQFWLFVVLLFPTLISAMWLALRACSAAESVAQILEARYEAERIGTSIYARRAGRPYAREKDMGNEDPDVYGKPSPSAVRGLGSFRVGG